MRQGISATAARANPPLAATAPTNSYKSRAPGASAPQLCGSCALHRESRAAKPRRARRKPGDFEQLGGLVEIASDVQLDQFFAAAEVFISVANVGEHLLLGSLLLKL